MIGYHDNSLPGILGQQEEGGLVQRMCWILMMGGVSQDPETCAREREERERKRREREREREGRKGREERGGGKAASNKCHS